MSVKTAQINLTPRLRLVASKVRNGSRVCDVGTDHCKIPVWLVQSGICPSAIATDIVPGPLSAAKRLIDRYGLSDRIETRQCDGLDGVSSVKVDDVVIAGMGGESIVDILRRAPGFCRENVNLVLQPMTDAELVRMFLTSNGYAISDEELCAEGHRLYIVLVASAGKEAPVSAIEAVTGRILAAKNDSLYGQYIEKRLRHYEYVARGGEDVSEIIEALRRECFK